MSFSFFPGELTRIDYGSESEDEATEERLLYAILGFSSLLTAASLGKITPACQNNSSHDRIADSSSTDPLCFSSACTTKRWPSPRRVSAIQLFARWNQSLRRSTNSNRLCWDCRRWSLLVADHSTRARTPLFIHGHFYGLRNFCCKTAQFLRNTLRMLNRQILAQATLCKTVKRCATR